MLFQRDIEPRCEYCQRGAQLGDGQVLCVRKGVVASEGHCRRFKYDPLRRTPPMPVTPDFSRLKDEDFTL